MTTAGSAVRSLRAATILATAASAAGYVASVAQWAVYARVLGASAATDELAAVLAWLVALTGFIGTTFTSLVTPAYVQSMRGDSAAARPLFRTWQSVALALGALITGATLVAADPLAAILLPGSGIATQEHTAQLLRLISPLGVLWVAVYTTSSLANAHERYVLAAASSVVPSIPVIVGLVLAAKPTVELVGVAFEVGLLAQIVILVAVTWPWRAVLVPLPARPALAALAPNAASVGAAFLIFGAGALALRSFASFGARGEVTVLDYGLRLTSALESLLLSGFLAISLTVWSVDALGGPARLPIVPAMRAALGLITAAALALAVLSTPVVSILFGGGRLQGGDIGLVARFVTLASLGLAAHAVYLLVVRLILARQALSVLLGSAVVQLLTLLTGSWLLGSALGLDGLALAYGLSWLAALLVAILSITSLRVDVRALSSELGRAIAAGAIPAVAAVIVVGLVQGEPLVQLVAGSLVFSVGWLVLASAVGLEAMRVVVSSLPARLVGRT